MSTAPKSKTLATWLAVLGGTLGAHRFYLHGLKDPIAWLHPLPTLLGLAGVIRMRNLGQDDTVSWLLIPILGGMISLAMLSAILIGLTNDERWAARFGVAGQEAPSTGWGPVLGVIVALFLGGAVLMGSIAFGGQKYFEWQKEKAAATAAVSS
ncbi:MAG: hypothetical protein C4K60_06730 [Ideonella sp. MAG2]|nr:MAG: hypothetical protein C4K60_06730 [Ideonella sp. MAG2]